MMKKMVLAVILILFAVNVDAAETCVKTNYTQDSDFTDLSAYTALRNKIYEDAKVTKLGPYSTIKCKKTVELSTPGSPTDSNGKAAEGYYIYSGLGFSYQPMTVKITYNCYGKIEHLKLKCDWIKATKDAERKALEDELNLYINWTNTEFEKNIAGSAATVSIDMQESFLSAAVNAKLRENSGTEIYSNTTGTFTNVQDDVAFTVKATKDSNSINKSGKLWQKSVTITQQFRPVLKKIVTTGTRYGDVLASSTACPGGATCQDLDNKLYTDFSMGTGIHPIKVVATYGGLRVNSSCGYVLYNNGAQGWHDLLNYRQVDPSNPFPRGAKGVWVGQTSLFGREFTSSPLETFTLSAGLIPEIRDYNKSVGVYKTKLASDSRYPSEYMQRYNKYYK